MTESTETSEWWGRHLEVLADHERRVGDALEGRLRFATTLFGVVAGGGPLILRVTGWWSEMSWFVAFLVGSGLFAAAGAALVAVAGLAPMDGRRWRAGTLARWLHDRGEAGPPLNAVAGLLPEAPGRWRDVHRRARRTRADLPDRLRAAMDTEDPPARSLASSPAGRAVLVTFLKDTLQVDLGWWLAPAGDTEAADRLVETRLRLVLWWWLQRQVAAARARLLRVSLGAGTAAAGLLLAGGLVFVAGWWLLLLLPVALVIGGVRLLRSISE